MSDKYVVSRKVISAPGAKIVLTVSELSKEAQDGLNTRGAHIQPPPVSVAPPPPAPASPGSPTPPAGAPAADAPPTGAKAS